MRTILLQLALWTLVCCGNGSTAESPRIVYDYSHNDYSITGSFCTEPSEQNLVMRSIMVVNTTAVSRGTGSCGDGVDEHLLTCPDYLWEDAQEVCCQEFNGGVISPQTQANCCDLDGDGIESTWCGGEDCNDLTNRIYPGALYAMADSDMDGLPDLEEEGLLSDPLLRDTDGDGLGDFVEILHREEWFDPLDPLDASCDDEERESDTDRDGLGHCEERLLGTSVIHADTDGDSILDSVELRFGTNPTGHDSFRDDDEDGLSNIDEIRRGLDPHFNDSSGWADSAYQFNLVQQTSERDDGSTCYDLEIENIAMASCKDYVSRLMLYIEEEPLGAPSASPRVMVACLQFYYSCSEDTLRAAALWCDQPYLDPPSRLLHVRPEDFVPLPVFDPDQHCVDLSYETLSGS